MTVETPTADCTQKANEYFHTIRLRVADLSAAERLWDRCLGPAERRRLGRTLPEAVTEHGNAIRMWMRLHNVSYQRAVIEVGEAVGFLTANDVDWLLREGGELSRHPEVAQAEAIDRLDLVIERISRSAYWNGELIDVDWYHYGEAWEFLVLACEHTKRNEDIDRSSFGRDSDEDVVTKKKHRLKKTPGFPAELIAYFRVVEPKTQRFGLPAERIHFF